MRLYIGSFDENEANQIVEDLRRANIRSELRHSLKIDVQHRYYIEGKISELKEKYKEGKIAKIVKDIENYFEKAREIIEDGIEIKKFEESFLNAVFPERKKFEEIRKEFNIESMGEEEINKMIEKYGKEKVDDFFDEELYEIKFMPWIHSLLKENGIEYKDGKMYGKVNDDPHVKVYVEGEKNIPFETKVYVDKSVDVYANLIDAIYPDKIKEIAKERPVYIPLLFASLTIAKIMNGIENKMELEELIKKSKYFKEDGDEIFLADDAINEIIKTLEKGEVIRVKKGKVILKEKKKRG